MTSIKLTVSGASARAEVDGLLTSGMVGIPVAITYDSAWDGLTKSMVCRAGHIVKTILNVGNTATVAHECMVPNQTLYIGIEGRNADGTLVIPTIWARCGLICSGANAEADPSTDPTLPVWAQVQQLMTDLAEQSAGSAKAAQEAAEQSAESRDAAVESEEHSAASARAAQEAAAAAQKSAAAADQSAEAAAASESGAALSANTASAEARAAEGSADKAAKSQAAAQNALQGMVYVTFTVGANGHVLIRNGDLLGSTVFSLTPAGHLEVDY